MEPRIALQLWSVRDDYERAPVEVLERVAGLGYGAVETVYSLTGGVDWKTARTTLDHLGLTVCSMHAFFDELESELDAIATAAQALDVRNVVCAWVDSEQRNTLAGYEQVAATLDRTARLLSRRELRLSYHHHDFELMAMDVDGRSGLDVILDRVDPELLDVEVDVYWAHIAGLDPVEYLARLEQGGRKVVLLHCKDAGPPGMQPLVEPDEGLAVYNTEVGAGVLDFDAILRATPHAEWLVVEQDFSATDVYESAALSLRNLTALVEARDVT